MPQPRGARYKGEEQWASHPESPFPPFHPRRFSRRRFLKVRHPRTYYGKGEPMGNYYALSSWTLATHDGISACSWIPHDGYSRLAACKRQKFMVQMLWFRKLSRHKYEMQEPQGAVFKRTLHCRARQQGPVKIDRRANVDRLRTANWRLLSYGYYCLLGQLRRLRSQQFLTGRPSH